MKMKHALAALLCGLGVCVAWFGVHATAQVKSPEPPMQTSEGLPSKPEKKSATLLPVNIVRDKEANGQRRGDGWDPEWPAPSKQTPFIETQIEERWLPNPKVNAEWHIVTSKSEEERLYNHNINAKARLLFASGEADLWASERSKISDKSFKLVLVMKKQWGYTQLLNPQMKLKPECKLLLQNGKFETFRLVYGTHYLSREVRESRIALSLRVDQWGSTSQNEARTTVNGGASLPLGGGSIGVSTKHDIKLAASRGAVSVTYDAMGGDAKGLKELIVGTINSEVDFFTKIEGALETVLGGFTRENSCATVVTAFPMTEFGYIHNDTIWGDFHEVRLNTIAEAFYSAKAFAGQVHGVSGNAKEPLRTSLDEYLGKLDAYMLELGNLQQSVLAKEDGCLTKALPKRPRLDPLCEDLIAHFSDIDSRLAKLEKPRYEHVPVSYNGSRFVVGSPFGHKENEIHFSRPIKNAYVAISSFELGNKDRATAVRGMFAGLSVKVRDNRRTIDIHYGSHLSDGYDGNGSVGTVVGYITVEFDDF